MTNLFSQIDTVGKLLDAAALRQKVVSQNVANVNTPGYHRKEVRFEELLADAQKNQDVSKVQPVVAETPGLAERQDGNNVSIDMEMGLLNKNALLFDTYAQVLGSKLSVMRSAITNQQ